MCSFKHITFHITVHVNTSHYVKAQKTWILAWFRTKKFSEILPSCGWAQGLITVAKKA